MSETGRPTIFTDELMDDICARIAEGESVRSIARDESMPAMSTFFKWLRENDTFSEQYAIAKEQSTDALFEDILDIADNQVGNVVEIEPGKYVTIKDAAGINHAKLRVDARKWALSKLKPKKYGDKVQTEISGGLSVTSKKTLDDFYDETQSES